MAVTGVGLVVNAAVPHPQEWACFVLAFFSASFFCLGIGGMRSITPRLVAPERLIRGARAREHLELVRVGRRPGARRGADRRRSGSRRPTRSTSSTFVVGIASIVALPAIEPVADAVGPSLQLDRGRLPLRAQAAVVLGVHARRRQRDGLRDADGAVPGDRDAQVRRPARSSATSTRRRTRARSPRRSPPAGSRTCGGRGSRSRIAAAAVGRGDRGVRLRGHALARARAARASRAPPTTSAPSSARRSC